MAIGSTNSPVSIATRVPLYSKGNFSTSSAFIASQFVMADSRQPSAVSIWSDHIHLLLARFLISLYFHFALDVYPQTYDYVRMPQLKLKSSHKAIRYYYATLQQYEQHDITHDRKLNRPA